MGLTTTTWPARQETGEPPAQKLAFLGGEPRHNRTASDPTRSVADLIRRSTRSIRRRSGMNPLPHPLPPRCDPEPSTSAGHSAKRRLRRRVGLTTGRPHVDGAAQPRTLRDQFTTRTPLVVAARAGAASAPCARAEVPGRCRTTVRARTEPVPRPRGESHARTGLSTTGRRAGCSARPRSAGAAAVPGGIEERARRRESNLNR